MADNRALPALVAACLLLVVFGLMTTAASAGRNARNVPLLVFPNGGTFKFVVGVTTPVKLPNRTLVMQLQFQWLYSELTNISQAEQDLSVTVTMGRAAAYDAVASLMDSLGVDGHTCLLRAICEAAETPLLHNGLLGELAHLLLTPGEQEPELRPHREARDVGRRGAGGGSGGGGGGTGGGGSGGGACMRRYAACRPGHGLLDAFSRLIAA